MATKIRVLHVFSKMDRGGAETMIMDLYRKIDRDKIQFDFVVHSKEKGHFDEEIGALGGQIYSVPKYSGSNHRKYVSEWKNLLRGKDFHIVHGHVRSTATLYLTIAKKNDLITIAHSHNTSNGKGITAIAKNIFQLPLRKIADYFFAASADSGRWLFGDQIVHQENFFVLNNAIQTEKYIFNEQIRNDYRKKLNIEDNFVIGHIGSFKKQKNHDFLLKILEEVNKNGFKVKLVLIGDGIERKRIELLADKMKLSNQIIFTGVRKDIPELLQMMDVFVFPSLFEGFGIVAIEAQAAGLRTIVSDEIPKEAYVTNLIESLSLKEDASLWAKKINEYSKPEKRMDTSNEIIRKGFDVSNTVKELTEQYIKMYSK